MGKIILKIIGLTLVSVGVILIYDARKITKKTFSFGDQNEATLGFKNSRIFIINIRSSNNIAQLGTVLIVPFAQFGTPFEKNS